jgi:hypothetical protein
MLTLIIHLEVEPFKSSVYEINLFAWSKYRISVFLQYMLNVIMNQNGQTHKKNQMLSIRYEVAKFVRFP